MLTAVICNITVGFRYFPKGVFPSINFPSGNFPNVLFLKRQLLRRRRLKWGRAMRLGRARGPSAAVRTGCWPSAATRTDLRSCRLGNCTFGKLPLGKISLGNCRLGKCLWKVPNIVLLIPGYCSDKN